MQQVYDTPVQYDALGMPHTIPGMRTAEFALGSTLTLECGMGRLAAAANASRDLDDLLRMLGGASGGPATPFYPYLARVRREQRLARHIYAATARRQDRLLWESDPAGEPSTEQLAAADNARRQRGLAYIRPALVNPRPVRQVDVLGTAPFVPRARFAVPSPTEAAALSAKALADPSLLYSAPSHVPRVEVSRRMAGPVGLEYLVRFPSPSPFTADTAYARVYEPADTGGPLPTLIFGSSLSSVYDQIPFWPEEAAVGRRMAAWGYRVVMNFSPWHGPRTPVGFYSGEAMIARGPVGYLELFSAQVQEIAVLIRWARSLGAPAVAVGGVSLGALVAQQVVGRCADWPQEMRPDAALLAATCSHVDRLFVESELNQLLGGDRAVRAAGWTDTQLRNLRPVLDPPPNPGLSPDRIVALLGRQDDVAPYAYGVDLIRRWGLPEENAITWSTGHFGVLLGMLVDPAAQRLVANIMDRC